jgi:3-hydroxyacyl-CoA dehydrogenase
MPKVALVGSGLVGTAWSIVFARAGHDVALYDPVDGAAAASKENVAEALPDLAARSLLNGQAVEQILGRLRPVARLEDALDGAAHVQESAPERLALKRQLYIDLDRLAAPSTVIASSTSALPASAFTETLTHRERCLVAHPINPPHLVPLVELVPAPWTSPHVVERTEALMRTVKQSPIRLSREIDGFVVNRLQSAILAEAFKLVADDVCGVGDIDAAVAEGLGMRWFFMGPMETIDLNAPGGLADYCEKLGPMYQELAKEQAAILPWTKDVVGKIEGQRRRFLPESQLAERRAWRDRCLAALAAAKRQVADEYGR